MKLRYLALATAVAVLPLSAAAQPRPAAYHAPRAVDGQPDLQGAWTNATLTPLERPAALGERKVMTPDEVAAVEGKRAQVIAASNAPTKAGVDFEKQPCYAANTIDGGATPDWWPATPSGPIMAMW